MVVAGTPLGRTESTAAAKPHLSYSQVARYLECPEKYRLHYLLHLRPIRPSAGLVFGKVVHAALSDHFLKGEDPVGRFSAAWEEVRSQDLNYSKRESWETLSLIGRLLLSVFMTNERHRIRNIQSSEEVFELAITTLSVPFIGVLDLKADVDNQSTVVDFKTSARGYEPHEVILSDQLSAYYLAAPDVARVALCVLVKAKDPSVEWHFGTRTPAQLEAYLKKVGVVAAEITAGHFYRRVGMWCSWCEFLPVCLGDKQKAVDTLIQIT